MRSLKKISTIILTAGGCWLAASTALAHHSFSMFDPDTEMVVTGKSFTVIKTESLFIHPFSSVTINS